MSTTETSTKLSKMDYIRKQNLFKGTIAVCIVYAVVAFALLFIIKFTERGQVMLDESNFPFAITFAFGMVIVITILAVKVKTFKVKAVKPDIYDNMMCPDFWKLQETDKKTLDSLNPKERIGKEYTCVRDPSIPGVNNVTLDLKSGNQYERQLAEMAKNVYGESIVNKNDLNKVSMDCGSIYPQHMSRVDMINNPDTQNDMRCMYAEKCGLPWSSVCPDME